MTLYGYTNDYVDPREAYEIASKLLHIIFMILILLANGSLIFKNARKLDFIFKPKTLTILSLAIGDVFVALFPMIVEIQFLFGDYEHLSCRSIVAAFVYGRYLITFVYDIGLMVLGFEILQSHRHSLINKNKQIIYSLAYSSFPWILGLTIILPLGISNTCQEVTVAQTLGQSRALIVIAIILPACGAVIASIVVKNRRSSTVNSPAQASAASSSQSTTFTAQTPNPERVIPLIPSELQTSTHSPPPTDPTAQEQFPNYPQPPPQSNNQRQQQSPQIQTQHQQMYNQPQHQQLYNQPQHQQLYNLPQHEQSPQLYNQPQHEQSPQLYNQPQHEQSPQLYNQPQQFENLTHYPGHLSKSTSQTTILIRPDAIPSDATLKSNRLLAITIVNFFLVILIASFELSYLPRLNSEATVMSPTIFYIVQGLMIWLNYLRPVITPL